MFDIVKILQYKVTLQTLQLPFLLDSHNEEWNGYNGMVVVQVACSGQLSGSQTVGFTLLHDLKRT